MLNIIKLLSKRQHVFIKETVLNSHFYLHFPSLTVHTKQLKIINFLIGKQGYLNQPVSHTVVIWTWCHVTWCHVMNGGLLEIRFYSRKMFRGNVSYSVSRNTQISN